MIRKFQVVVMLSLAFLLIVVPATADNLLADGSFETPAVTPPNSTCGTYGPAQCFYVGNDIGAWTVIGKSDGTYGTVMLMTNAYQETVGGVSGGTPLYFHVEDGSQALDLTGEGNQNTAPGIDDGVKQSVTLGAGQYDLTFWLGHQDNTAPGYAGASSLSLWIDGTQVNTYSNNLNTSDDVTWEEFSYDFTASGYTTIAFINNTPIGNNYAGLDNVSLSQVPEPASLLLVVSGFAGLFVRRFRK